jgi:hypothetical protein
MRYDDSFSIFLLKFLEDCHKAKLFSIFTKIFRLQLILYLDDPSISELKQQFLTLKAFEEFKIMLFPLFLETIKDLDEQTRQLLLFDIKLQIENNFKNLEWTPDNEASAINREWETKRLEKISNYSELTLLGTCIDCGAVSSQSIDILKFMELFTIEEDYEEVEKEEGMQKVFTRYFSLRNIDCIECDSEETFLINPNTYTEADPNLLEFLIS